jgi:hypothetical protein
MGRCDLSRSRPCAQAAIISPARILGQPTFMFRASAAARKRYWPDLFSFAAASFVRLRMSVPISAHRRRRAYLALRRLPKLFRFDRYFFNPRHQVIVTPLVPFFPRPNFQSVPSTNQRDLPPDTGSAESLFWNQRTALAVKRYPMRQREIRVGKIQLLSTRGNVVSLLEDHLFVHVLGIEPRPLVQTQYEIKAVAVTVRNDCFANVRRDEKTALLINHEVVFPDQ